MNFIKTYYEGSHLMRLNHSFYYLIIFLVNEIKYQGNKINHKFHFNYIKT